MCQGSAADIVKLSVNKLVMMMQNYNVQIILQIHDELVLEIQEDQYNTVL